MEAFSCQQEVIYQPPHHVHTFIWIHGLNQTPQSHGKIIADILYKYVSSNLRLVLPRALKRYVTQLKKEALSWFDIKFRGPTSFKVQFDEAFSSAEVHESYEKILAPTIQREFQLLNQKQRGGKLMIGGFSQGCGMSLHCLYENPDLIYSCVGVAGYLFPFSKFSKAVKNQKKVIFGLKDKLRPWEYVQETYKGKFEEEEIVLVGRMGHEMDNFDTKITLFQIFSSMLLTPKL